MMIASRVLKLNSPDGDVEVPVRIFLPEANTEGSFDCVYQIGWPDGQRTMTASGIDSVQALINALQMIGSEIYTSNFHKSGDLYLDQPGQGYGFPVPNSIRHLLTGDDTRFF
jgi:uncharacterized protein DUF6968